MPLPDGLLCLTAQSQEHAGDSRRQAVTLGKLDGAIESLVSAHLFKEEQDQYCHSPTK